MASVTVSEVRFLLEVLPLNDPTRHAIEMVRVPLIDHLAAVQIDEIRDLCGERLQAVGFDSDYEPTAEGRVLETLIDKLLIEGQVKPSASEQ